MTAVSEQTPATQNAEDRVAKPGRILRIHVTEQDKPTVNVKIPLSIARMGAKLGARFAGEDLEKHGIDLDQLLKEIDTPGKIVDVTDERSHVEIYVE